MFRPTSSQRKEKDITLPVHVHHRIVKVGAFQLQNFSGRPNDFYINKHISAEMYQHIIKVSYTRMYLYIYELTEYLSIVPTEASNCSTHSLNPYL